PPALPHSGNRPGPHAVPGLPARARALPGGDRRTDRPGRTARPGGDRRDPGQARHSAAHPHDDDPAALARPGESLWRPGSAAKAASAVDDDALAGDEAGAVGGEEAHGVSDVGGGAPPPPGEPPGGGTPA